jgi:uncharacterized protein
MAVAPLLIGWPLLPLPDDNGQLHYPTLADSVRHQIQVIFRTKPGEQLMRPDFGGGLENLLHEPNTLATRVRIRDLVTESLERWERRIIVDRVEVSEVVDHPTQVRVEIAYRLRRTGLAQQLGVSVELGG